MKLALIAITALAGTAFAVPALAQAVIEDPGYCAQFYPNGNCQNLGSGNLSIKGSYYRGSQDENAMMSNDAAEPDAHRYHGGPKSDD